MPHCSRARALMISELQLQDIARGGGAVVDNKIPVYLGDGSRRRTPRAFRSQAGQLICHAGNSGDGFLKIQPALGPWSWDCHRFYFLQASERSAMKLP